MFRWNLNNILNVQRYVCNFYFKQQTDNVQLWINPSKSLVDRALEKWSSKRLRADNTSVVTLMLDPPGPSRSEVYIIKKYIFNNCRKKKLKDVGKYIDQTVE